MIDLLPWYSSEPTPTQAWWWANDDVVRTEPPRTDVGYIPVTDVTGAATLVISIFCAKSAAFPAPPSAFQFYRRNDGSTHLDLDDADAYEPLFSNRTPVGAMDAAGTFYHFTYVIELDSDQTEELWYAPLGDVIGSSAIMAATAYYGVGSLASRLYLESGLAPSISPPPYDVLGFWVNVVAGAFDDYFATLATLEGGHTGFKVNEDAPLQIVEIGNIDPETATWEIEPSQDFDLHAVYIHLRAAAPAAEIDLPSLIASHSFLASTATIGGQERGLPQVTATHGFDASVSLPSSGAAWWCVLVDSAGTTVARMPRAVIGSIVETLNDIDTADVTIPIRSRAGELIDAAEVLPDLEVQIWRGRVLWMWGPIIDAQPDGDHWQLSVRDCRWHLTRRHVGELGGTFGGRPPYFHDSPANLRFEQGSLAGWSILRTTSIGEFVGFSTPDLNAIRLAPETHLPSGEPMARCVSPLDPLDNYQLYQDLKIRGPQNRRPLNVTLSGWWFLPSAGNFAPNNQRMGLVLATLLDDAKLPGAYYLPEDVEFTTLDESSPRDELFYQECKLELPPGVETTVHVAVCFPQGVTFIGGLDLTVDDGLLYNESPSTIGPGLVMHAQDPAFEKSDVNIDWVANTVGDVQIREFVFNEHTNIGQAIAGLASEGWFDWFMTYAPGSRWATFTAPRRGGYRPRARIRLDANGRGNVEAVERRRMWQSGSTVVAAQTRSNGNHERAARSAHDLTLEEVFVAQREPRDYDLPRHAEQRLGPAEAASVVEVSTSPGDERFLLDLQLGDTTDINCAYPGHRVSGRHRVVRREVLPERDSVRVTLNPEPA